MIPFLQTFFDGLTVGSLYALIALGYTMVYGILKFINFAHSDVFCLGVWMTILWSRVLGVGQPGAEAAPVWYGGLILLLAMLSCGVVGFAIERMAYRPLRGAPRLNVLITAIGVSLFMQNTGQLPVVFGPYPKPMPTLLPGGAWEVGGFKMPYSDVAVIGTAIALMVGLQWLVFGTKVGMAMRAVSYNTRNASLMGINVDRVISVTFTVGAMLAAAAGFLYSVKYGGQAKQTADSMWVMLGLKAFVAAVVGGIGNIRGAVLGGLIIGLVEFFTVRYSGLPEYRDAFVFAILILVLLFKPEGVLGKATIEKV